MSSSFSTKFLAFIGAVWVSRWILNTCRFFYIYLRSSSLEKYCSTSSSGAPPWAIITGASDGIGRGYAFELARQNFNLVLHGRNYCKLQVVESAILKIYPSVNIKLVVADAANYGPASFKEIDAMVDSIKDLHITILINNCGTGTRPTGHVFSNFERDLPSDIDAILNTNARFPLQLTRAILPLLLSHKQPSLLLTMGSISEIGSPYLSVYSSTKALCKSWSRALTREMKAEGNNVEVLCIHTCQVTETATEDKEESLITPKAMDFARSALSRAGCGWDVVEGCWTHGILHAVTGRLPSGFFSDILTDSVREEMKKEGKSA